MYIKVGWKGRRSNQDQFKSEYDRAIGKKTLKYSHKVKKKKEKKKEGKEKKEKDERPGRLQKEVSRAEGRFWVTHYPYHCPPSSHPSSTNTK